jgi:DNA (cytosine-5)-methyltransferase 1
MRKEMKINVVTLCSGYDSQALALERIKKDFPDFDYELIAWAEYDPDSKAPLEKQPAVVAHNALFPLWQDRNMGDITKANWSIIKEPIDLLCYSTPC